MKKSLVVFRCIVVFLFIFVISFVIYNSIEFDDKWLGDDVFSFARKLRIDFINDLVGGFK